MCRGPAGVRRHARPLWAKRTGTATHRMRTPAPTSVRPDRPAPAAPPLTLGTSLGEHCCLCEQSREPELLRPSARSSSVLCSKLAPSAEQARVSSRRARRLASRPSWRRPRGGGGGGRPALRSQDCWPDSCPCGCRTQSSFRLRRKRVDFLGFWVVFACGIFGLV